MQINPSVARGLYDWYYSPGEKIRSIGFYVNPYKRWEDVRFKHIFAFDKANLYVGQFSVYPKHIDEIFGKRIQELKSDDTKVDKLAEKIEHGFIIPGKAPAIHFDFIESKNIIFLNRRLKIMAQRFYDYGMPTNSVILADSGLGSLSLYSILRGSPLERPDKQSLHKLL